MNPLLLNIPTTIETPRLILRAPREGDGKELNAAAVESFDDLHEWIPWAKTLPTLEDSELRARRSSALWITREDFLVLSFEKASQTLVGCTGLHRINWDTGCMEIGYWCRSSFVGKGLTSEAVNALTRIAFSVLKANRVELRCNPENAKSIKVAERLGYEYEGTLRRTFISPKTGQLQDSRVYARLSADGLPPLEIKY